MSETAPVEAEITPDVFQPSKGRIGFAALVALGAFFIPQEIPLEYYPLNDPSSGLQYIEITCAANVTGTTEIFLDTGRGINELDKISWPIGPSEMAFTYTFPLADTPLLGLRLDPLEKAGELRITNFRIINRKGEEIRRITRDHLVPVHQIDHVEPLDEGWKIITSPGANDPFLRVSLDSPTLPVGMNIRNLQRCLLSTSYLAMMLTILLLAVFFAFRRPEPWRLTLARVGFLALLGLMFSFVGNRGLIRNSIRYGQFPVPVPSNALQLEFDVNAQNPGVAQLFWDTGNGTSETDSARTIYENTRGLQTLRFSLPDKPIKLLRFDPFDSAGTLTVRRIRISDGNGNVRAVLSGDAFLAQNEIAQIEVKEDGIVNLVTTQGSTDSITLLKREVVGKINQIRTPAPK